MEFLMERSFSCVKACVVFDF